MKKGRGGNLPALLFLLAFMLSGCFQAFHRQVRTELFFGMAIPGSSSAVSAAEWEEFLANEVTPRFPGGFTILDGRGQWRDSSGVISRELSKVLVVIRDSGKTADAKVEEIRKAYRERYRQESVLRTDSPVRASF